MSKMRKLLFIWWLLCSTNFSIAQIAFHNTFQGIGAERGYSVEVCSDGYMVVGCTNSFGAGQNDILVIKTDLNGAPIWKKNYGGYNDDVGVKIKRINDANFIIVGTTSSFTTDSMNFYILKIDSLGGLIWSGVFGGPNQDSATTFVQTYDNGLLIAGRTTSIGAGKSDVYLLKLDSAGNYVWAKAIGNSGNDIPTSILEMADHGFLISGYTDGFGFPGNNPFLLRTDVTGNVQWVKTYEPASYWNSNRDCRANDIIKGYLNDYLFIGQECCGSVGDGRHFVIDMDSLGNPNWMKDYQFNSGASSGRSIIKTLDGNFLIGGVYSSGAAELLKIDVLGVIQWAWYYNAGPGFEIKGTPDNQCVFTGYDDLIGDYIMFLIKPEVDGTLNCLSSPTFTSFTSNITPTITNKTFTSTMTNFNLMDSCNVSVSGINYSSLCLYTKTENISLGNYNLSFSPNPSTGKFTISFADNFVKGDIEIYSVLGEKVFSEKINNKKQKEINLKNIAPGIYFVKVFDGEKYFCKKIVIEKT